MGQGYIPVSLIRSHFPNIRSLRPSQTLGERTVEVVDKRQTGEVILDEAFRLMNGQQEIQKLSVNIWIDPRPCTFPERKQSQLQHLHL